MHCDDQRVVAKPTVAEYIAETKRIRQVQDAVPDPGLWNLILRDRWEVVSSFVGAVARHIASGAYNLAAEEIDERLSVCEACPERRGLTCSVCKCNIAIKAKWRDQECPLGKWKSLDSQPTRGTMGSP